MRERLRLAIPNKGRLVEPTLALLHDAGLVFEEHVGPWAPESAGDYATGANHGPASEAPGRPSREAAG